MKHKVSTHSIGNTNVCKAIITLLLVLFTSICSFGQNIDWSNAPINPIPQGADLKYQNVKGDVFQDWMSRYARNGERLKSRDIEIIKDHLGRVILYKTDYNTGYHYKYDSRGNLIEEKSDHHINTYTYDSNNRLSKLTYISLKDNATRSSQFSYKINGDVLVVLELETSFKGEKYEKERLFKNGFEIQHITKGYPGDKYEYEFDKKGNWIKKTYINASTNKIKTGYDNKPVKPTTRDIIYYDEYDKAPTNATAFIKDLSAGTAMDKKILVPEIFIAGKKLSLYGFERFNDDFIFYDPNINTYYIVRNAYNKNNTVGQELPVEKMISDAENMLLYEGKYLKVVEKGKSTKEVSDWKTESYRKYLKCYVSINQNSGSAYAFENMPTVADGKTVAIAGKSINGIWYIPTDDKKYVFLFEDGNLLADGISFVGYLSGNNDVVYAANGKPKYIASNFDNAIDYQFSQVRLFNPATDKIKTQTTSSNTTQTTTTIGSNTNTADAYSGLSVEAKAFMEMYKTNPNGLKNYVQNLHKSWEEKGSSTSDINAKYIDMYQELYTKDKVSAFELLMKLPFKWKEPHLKIITTYLTDEQKAYNRQKAQEIQKKYSNSYDLKTN